MKIQGWIDADTFRFLSLRKEDKPNLVGMTPALSGNTPATLREW